MKTTKTDTTTATTSMILADLPAHLIDQAEAHAAKDGIDVGEWITGAMRDKIAATVPVQLPAAMVNHIERFTAPAGMTAAEFIAGMLEDCIEQTAASTDEHLTGVPDFVLTCWARSAAKNDMLRKKFHEICRDMR